jgi:hypothetical protein
MGWFFIDLSCRFADRMGLMEKRCGGQDTEVEFGASYLEERR